MQDRSKQFIEQEMPSDLVAEKTILGSIMNDNALLYQVTQSLTSDDFYLDSNRRIMSAMEYLSEDNCAIDLITLGNRLRETKELESVGGFSYISDLNNDIPRKIAIDRYVSIVKDKSISRKLISLSSKAIEMACGGQESAQESISSIRESLDSIGGSIKPPAQSVSEIQPAVRQKFEALMHREMGAVLGASLMTPEMDRVVCGIRGGELCLLAARPGQGKTEGALQVVLNNARRGLRVHFQSLEMGRDELLPRLWRLLAKIDVWKMRDPRCLNASERQRLREAQEELSDLPIQIDDQHELTIGEFRSRAILASKRWKADLLVVDYGQLLQVPRARNIIEAAPKQAETLRHIARDYCATLALVQLRRTPPNDLNRYPDIEDILGSSAWEQAGQIILMLHRTRENKRYTGEDYCFLGKMRELQTIEPFGICAEPWGEFKDRHEERQ